ncbi:hypothetical protein D3C75_718580 [compost metagenome]
MLRFVIVHRVQRFSRRYIDEIHTDAVVGHAFKNLQLYTGSVAIRAFHRNLGNVADISDPRDKAVHHSMRHIAESLRMGHKSAFGLRECRTHTHRDLGLHCNLNSAGMNDLGALISHVADLSIADVGQLLRIFDNPRISGQNAVHIGVDIDHIRPQRSAKCRSRGIAAPASQCRKITGFGLPLEPGYNNYFMLAQFA